MKSKYQIILVLGEIDEYDDFDQIDCKTILEFEESKSGARKVFKHVCEETKP